MGDANSNTNRGGRDTSPAVNGAGFSGQPDNDMMALLFANATLLAQQDEQAEESSVEDS
jgi:hypothetical protein